MKVNGVGVSQMIEKYRNNNQRRNKKIDNNKKGDRLSLSDQAMELQKIKGKLSVSPNLRKEKVAQLKAQVKQGTYHVSGEKIAEKMLEQVMIDKRV